MRYEKLETQGSEHGSADEQQEVVGQQPSSQTRPCVQRATISIENFSFSVLFFSWFSPMIALGKETRRKFRGEDMLPLPPGYTCSEVYAEFLNCWAQEAPGPLRLWRSLHRLIFFEFWIAGLNMGINSLTVLLSPVLLKWIVQSNSTPNNTGMTLFLACCIMVNAVVGAITVQQFIHGVFMTGSKAVSAGTSVVLYATLSLRMHRMKPTKTVGEINNIMSKDSASLREFVVFAHNLWAWCV